MIKYFKRLFSKSEELHPEMEVHLPKDENATFELKVDKLVIGTLQCENGEWKFKYTDDFKKHRNEYNHIAGFSNLDKTYINDTLWPFFQTRIPGLKQPAVKEILKKEHINESNELELLKRFGKKTISNPYELELV
ncbi:HipA N-terminal domain-containing protein [Pedobacter mucosus]|uniref:HipA N-terminal domain-containing protein n=1 Tax=Pedobacter mucosus TaxID=2895286 RepID=UPI001EE4D9F8|nr:HipA N-terminal domain-containing protein [Pedobacter mucosus]UKT65022.1 HipA N-terminal domain-containing protein [Pedobacter mucosus]